MFQRVQNYFLFLEFALFGMPLQRRMGGSEPKSYTMYFTLYVYLRIWELQCGWFLMVIGNRQSWLRWKLSWYVKWNVVNISRCIKPCVVFFIVCCPCWCICVGILQDKDQKKKTKNRSLKDDDDLKKQKRLFLAAFFSPILLEVMLISGNLNVSNAIHPRWGKGI